jgi:hypothetical protein
MTKKELSIFVMGIAAVGLLYHMHKDDLMRYILFLYGWGLVFETVTNNLWRYSDDLGKTRFCAPNTHVNLLFPLGWMLQLSVADFFATTIWEYMLYGGTFGCLLEIVFFNLKYWVYQYDQKFLGLYHPFKPRIAILGVPIQVILSYYLVNQILNWYVMERLLP